MLIGRLLYDSQLILDDQLVAAQREPQPSRRRGGLDFSLLVDGLSSEREQGITIDVAYRFFSTDRRKFIVADTPGHEQYTRNMATGASNAELALVLVDARKGILTQTRRHSFILSLIGVKHVVLVVNKIDLVGYDPDVFQSIESDYQAFARDLGFETLRAIPISALRGDNILKKSANTPWYEGPQLLPYLEDIEVASDDREAAALPVQWVNRPDLDFAAFPGPSPPASSRWATISPSPPRASRPGRAHRHHGRRSSSAVAGEAVTLVLDREVDISAATSRASGRDARNTDALPGPHRMDGRGAGLSWALLLLKIGAQQIPGTITELRFRTNVNTLEERRQDAGAQRGRHCPHRDRQPIAFDSYEANPGTGSFILIDPCPTPPWAPASTSACAARRT